MLQIAIRFYEKGSYATDQPAKPGSKRKLKLTGYQVSKTNYEILKAIAPDSVQDIPRSRIVEYRYIQVDAAIKQQNRYFLLPIPEAQLPQIEAITKTEHNPSVYLWRDGRWWSFPQLETYTDGEMQSYTITRTDYGTLSNLGKTEPVQQVETRQIEKTKIRIRETYEASKGPGFLLADAASSLDSGRNPAGFPPRMTGNGMVLEWKQGYADKNACWWLRDEKRVSKAESATYKNYATIKATYRARWSRGFNAWYYTGGEHPPQSWLDLVGYKAESAAMSAELAQQIEDVLAQDEGQAPELIPLRLIEANDNRYNWNFGNPDVWGKLVNRRDLWMFYVANASLTERSIYGYKLHLGGELHGEWVTLAIPDLDPKETQRDPNFTRQSLASAIRTFANTRPGDLPDEVLSQLKIPSDAECRSLRFQEQQREIAAEQAAKRAHEERLKPYQEFQNLLKFQQASRETWHHLSGFKALPALATPPLDDPWS